MFDSNWPATITFADRYGLTGITDLVTDYVRKSGKKRLVIIDVGCSTAVALKRLQNEMKTAGIEAYTIGIDLSKKVKREAEKNVDEFINMDILKIDNKRFTADIVICSKMAIYVSAKRRSNILLKSSELLKNDGALITDVDYYEKISFLETLKYLQYFWPSFGSMKYGFRKWHEEWMRRVNLPYKKKMRMIISRKNALDYPRLILEGWNKLKWYKKLYWYSAILLMRILWL